MPVAVTAALPGAEAGWDEAALLHDRISVSAGLRGVQMVLAPDDLQRITNATLADLCEE